MYVPSTELAVGDVGPATLKDKSINQFMKETDSAQFQTIGSACDRRPHLKTARYVQQLGQQTGRQIVAVGKRVHWRRIYIINIIN